MGRPRRRVHRAVRRHGLGWGLSRVLGGVLMVALVLSAVGTGFQRLAAQRDTARFPPPGRMVTVDEQRIHLVCEGTGEPTVVLDGGLGEWSIQWRAVQERLARTTRTCAYDRAGYGWSAPGPPPRDGAQLADELHRLLRDAEVLPPYLLVGHGVAGFHLRAYAAAHPQWVAGLVLVDAVPPDMAELYDRLIAPTVTRLRQATLAAQLGLLRFTGPAPGIPLATGMEGAGGAYRRQLTYPAFYETYADEAAHVIQSAETADAARLPAGLPVLVIANEVPLDPAAKAPDDVSPERYDRAWAKHQAETAGNDPKRSLVMVRKPGANLVTDDPDGVAGAIQAFIFKLRLG
jgi:pimeloyl-ACP methyl ester carboxylesterase